MAADTREDSVDGSPAAQHIAAVTERELVRRRAPSVPAARVYDESGQQQRHDPDVGAWIRYDGGASGSEPASSKTALFPIFRWTNHFLR